MSLWTLYLISIIPNIGIFFNILCFLGFGIILIRTVMFIASIDCTYDKQTKEERRRDFKKWIPSLKKYIIILIILGLIRTAFPNERQIYMIAGGYAATNIEGINKLPANLVNAANSYLEKINENLNKKSE